MKCIRPLVFLVFTITCLPAFAQQYDLNGNAQANSCNCYTLTREANYQSGSAWNKTLFDLNNSFDFKFSVFLGCLDANGADGIAFLLQQVSTSLGATGGGLGFAGLRPSIGILLDTWQNTEDNDPTYDHISIQSNGRINHSTDLAGPVQASPTSTNIEDCAWHIFRITWDPVTQWLRAYFDGSLRVETQVDLIGTVFNNNPMVYWGFTAATGGSVNLQQFCTALAPKFNTGLTNNATCFGAPVTFTNTSESFAPIQAHYWDFGDGSFSTEVNPAPHQYAAPGLYNVKLALKGFDGCDSDTLSTVVAIGDFPVAAFDITDTCEGTAPRIIDRSSTSVGTISQWQWLLNDNPVSNSQNPQLTGLAPGNYTLKLSVTSNYGCGSAVVQKQFIIKPAPLITANAGNGCINIPLAFTASQQDNATSISNWNWQFGNGQGAAAAVTQYSYSQAGNFSASVVATASNGCKSNTVVLPVVVSQAVANAGNDTVFIRDQPFQLNGSGGTGYNWSPPVGLSDPTIANPTGVLQDDISYTLTVTTADGCVDDDVINITVFKGSGVYVPSGFTPNGDGRNETLMPYYVGIKNIDYFMVYNRWGQVLFTTKSIGAGWDGTIQGAKQASGVFIWKLRATDYVGKVYELKGTSTLIR